MPAANDAQFIARAEQRVSTAVAESASSRAISSVVKPPSTCRTRGSRYSMGNLMIAWRSANNSPPGSANLGLA